MKKGILTMLMIVQAMSLTAAPLRVALLDTEDLTGQKPDPVVGALKAETIARKGAPLVGKVMLKSDAFSVIDRRDFTSRVDRFRREEPLRQDNATVLQAARALRADAILKSSVLSMSAENRNINQAGYNVEFKRLTMRVMLEVLDTKDGSIIGIADGTASREFRITAADATTLGEDEILQMFESAVSKAMPVIEQSVIRRMERKAERGHVALTLKTLAEPAMVEIDGMLVGTTPIEKMEIYPGDHVITITKPGYQEISKRILITRNTTLTVPMLRNELTMEELKEIAKDMSLNRIAVMQPAWIMEQH